MTRPFKVLKLRPRWWKLLLTAAVVTMVGGDWLMAASPPAGLAVYAIGAVAMLAWIVHVTTRRAAKRGYQGRHSRDV